MTQEPVASHRHSHRSLLRHGKVVGGSVDAIVMPASRPAAHLLPSMEVAAGLGCHFVALCSGRTSITEAAGLAVEVPDLAWTLVDMRDAQPAGLLQFGTSEIREASDSRIGDLSRKRNTGLLLAHLARWSRVLFLDDDIRDVSPRAVRSAVSDLRPGRAAGMVATDFPDNSVVCHAARLAGRKQDVFVSGSALAVETTKIESFFPEVYNEDWLFLYDMVRERRVSATGIVRQAPYKPFAKAARAAGEEFGDLLAEGLMSVLHAGEKVERALEPDYWSEAIDQRHRLLREIIDGLEGRGDQPDGEAALAAVRAARTTLEHLDSAVLSMFVRRWREDVADWKKRLLGLDQVGSPDAALDILGLSRTTSGPGSPIRTVVAGHRAKGADPHVLRGAEHDVHLEGTREVAEVAASRREIVLPGEPDRGPGAPAVGAGRHDDLPVRPERAGQAEERPAVHQDGAVLDHRSKDLVPV